MRPNFLGIGVPRGGTTWLHELLDAHPEAYVPWRKDVHFFDNEFDRGWAWYEKLFPSGDEAARYKAVGEITPHYLYSPDAAERIRATPEIERLIAILRDPVERAFSHYRWRMQHDNYREGFGAFLEDYPESVAWSRYAEHVERYTELFGDRLLVLVHEKMFEDLPRTRERIAAHLGIDPAAFPEGAGATRVHTSFEPRFGGAYSLAMRGAAFLRRRGLSRVNHVLAKRLGVQRLFGRRPASRPVLDQSDRARAWSLFAADVERLERFLGADLSAWRRAASGESVPEAGPG